jgi:hypothetical protein
MPPPLYAAFKSPFLNLSKLSIILILSPSNYSLFNFNLATLSAFSLIKSSFNLVLFFYFNYIPSITPFTLLTSSYLIWSNILVFYSIYSISLINSFSFILNASLSATNFSSSLFLSYSIVVNFAFSKSINALRISSFSILALISFSFFYSNIIESKTRFPRF